MLIQNDVKYTNSALESLYLLTGNISIFHLSLSLIIQKVNFLFDHPTISKVEHAIPGKNIRTFIRTNKRVQKSRRKEVYRQRYGPFIHRVRVLLYNGQIFD